VEQRRLENANRTVSVIGMGTWELGGREWGEISEEDAVRLLRYAFEHGITLYDTSDQYGGGRVERLLGQAFDGRREQVTIATKVGYEIDSDGWISRGGTPPRFNASRDYLRSAVKGSLRRLGRDVIDLYQFHGPPRPEQWDEAFATMEELKSAGMIRAYGMALGTAEHALRAIRETGIAALMLTYNMLNQAMAERVMPAAQEKGIAIIVRQPLASGLLSGQLTPETVFGADDYRKTWPRERFLSDLGKVEAIRAVIAGNTPSLPQAALQFILAQPAVISVVPGLMTPAQVDDAVGTAQQPPLPASVVARLRKLGAAAG
jgi:myo-inositol catabolism protein IolS